MKGTRNTGELRLLLEILDQAYEKKAWHGPNLRGSIRGVSPGEAAWRPGKGRHNIRDIVLHAAYWKYAVRRRLLGEKRGTFTLKGSNWFRRPEVLTEKAWRQEIAMLDKAHRSVRKAIWKLSPGKLHSRSKGGATRNVTLIYGMASHDLYHAGQIQLIKRLARSRARF